ncbi:hypothetical protein tb265_46330 [Gemmatimonadetes bacterium T265]|nr:hypothetical protein tb265_46330 [Gemmatimonadetes bacterium T265]
MGGCTEGDDARAWRATGWLGVGLAALTAVEVSLYFVYAGPPPDVNILTRLLVNVPLIVGLIVFFASVRAMVVRAAPHLEWAATLLLALVVMYGTLTFVASALEGGLAIASPQDVDPTIAANGVYLLYGSIGRVLTAAFVGLAGYLAGAAGLLPRWTTRFAYALALFSLAFVPSLYFGNDPTSFYSANGWGTTAVAGSSMLYWVLAAGLAMLGKARRLRG